MLSSPSKHVCFAHTFVGVINFASVLPPFCTLIAKEGLWIKKIIPGLLVRLKRTISLMALSALRAHIEFPTLTEKDHLGDWSPEKDFSRLQSPR